MDLKYLYVSLVPDLLEMCVKIADIHGSLGSRRLIVMTSYGGRQK